MASFVIVKTGPKNTNLPALTIVVSKKVAKKAVQRNLLKRRIRAIVNTTAQKKEKNLMIITKAGVEKLSFQELKQEIVSQLNKLSLILNP